MGEVKASYHHGDLAQALVDAATRLVAERGVDDFSLRAAARAVGVSANATYRHFPDKRALLGAVAQRALDRMSEKMASAQAKGLRGSDGPRSIARFKATGRAYVAYAAEHPALFSLVFGPPSQRSLPEARGESPSPYEMLGAALDDLVSDGRLDPKRRGGAELRAWTVVHGFAALTIDGDASDGAGSEARFGSARARKAALEDLLDFVVDGLGVRRD